MLDVERLELVQTMTLAMSRARGTAEVHELLLRTLTRALGDVRPAVLLLDADGLLRFKAFRDLSRRHRDAIEASVELRGTDPEPVVVPDLTRVPWRHPDATMLRAEGIEALAVFPLLAGSGVIGKLLLHHRKEHALEALDAVFVRTLASVAAFAIEHQRAIEKLESERRLFMGGPTVIFTWQNQPGWPVEYVSPNLESQFGYRPEELTSGTIPYATLVHPEDLARVGGEVAEAVAREQPFFEQTYRLKHRDGSYRAIYDFTAVVRREGVVTHFQGYVIDVTKHEAADAALRSAEKRLSDVQRLESLGLLAGGIAHDFNNLLVGVLGNAGLALSELPADAPARATVESIRIAGQRAAELTRQLLAYSGKGKFVVEPVDVSQLIDESARLLATAISKTATVRYQLATGLGRVEADATQIRQVVLNLLTNSSDALEDQPGSITISTRREQVTTAREDLVPGEYVVVEVTDDGVGMSEAVRRRVFEPFFTTKFHGRGLGMAAVLGIAKGHRGAVLLESTEGRGSRASLYLPVLAATPVKAPERRPAASTTRTRPPTILVVDDENMIRTLTARVLRSEGFVVHEAENGRVALDRLESDPGIDLMLLDLTMPVMSGDATLSHVRERWPHLPVILSSGFSAESARAIGDVTAFIQKPYLPDDLLTIVRRILAPADDR